MYYCFVLSWIENLRLSSKHFYFGIYGNLFIASSELGWFSVGNFNQIKQDWLEKHSFIEKRSKQEILPRTPAFAQSIIFCLEYQTYENSVRRCFYEKIISFRSQQVRDLLRCCLSSQFITHPTIFFFNKLLKSSIFSHHIIIFFTTPVSILSDTWKASFQVPKCTWLVCFRSDVRLVDVWA